MMSNYLKNLFIKTADRLPLQNIYSGLTDNSTLIYMFHRFEDKGRNVDGHSLELLKQSLEYLRKKKYNLVSLEQVAKSITGEAPPLNRAICFTLDDGFLDQGEVAAPLFLQYDCPVTIFLITDFIDRKTWPWDDQVKWLFLNTQKKSIRTSNQSAEYNLSSLQEKYRAIENTRNILKTLPEDQFQKELNNLQQELGIQIPEKPGNDNLPMSWSKIRTLEKKGVSFGPHTKTHRILSNLRDTTLLEEIEGSWNRLRDELEAPLPVFCYPTGRNSDYDTRVIDILQRNSFLGAVTTETQYVKTCTRENRDNDQFEMGRYAFPANINDVIQYSGWIERLKNSVRGIQ